METRREGLRARRGVAHRNGAGYMNGQSYSDELDEAKAGRQVGFCIRGVDSIS